MTWSKASAHVTIIPIVTMNDWLECIQYLKGQNYGKSEIRTKTSERTKLELHSDIGESRNMTNDTEGN